MTKKVVWAVLIVQVAVLVAALAILVSNNRPTLVYDNGLLIDANPATGILYEEDGDPAELGIRLVALANGDTFTDAQVEQISQLTAGMFEELRWMGMDIERLQEQVRQLITLSKTD